MYQYFALWVDALMFFRKSFPLLSDKIVSYTFFYYCNNFTFHT